MRPWERAGRPKSTGWPTMWSRTTAPRAAESPQRSGGQEDTGGGGCNKEIGWSPSRFKEGNLSEHSKHEQIQPHILYTQRKRPLWNSWTSPPRPPLLPASFLALHDTAPLKDPHSRSPNISAESWWVKSPQSFAQPQQLVEHAAKGRELKHPLCPH